jgi:hypothetical protein
MNFFLFFCTAWWINCSGVSEKHTDSICKVNELLQVDAEEIRKKNLWLHRHDGNIFADHSSLNRECGDQIFLRR